MIPHFVKEYSSLFHSAQFNLTEDQMNILGNGLERNENNKINSIEIIKNSPIEITWRHKQQVEKVRLIFDSNFSDKKHIPCTFFKNMEPSFLHPHLPKNIIIKFLNEQNQWENHSEVNDNYRRYLEIPIDKDTLGLQICITDTWGSEIIKVFTIEPI